MAWACSSCTSSREASARAWERPAPSWPSRPATRSPACFCSAATVEALGLAPYGGAFRELWRYARKYRNLALAGALYAAATWVDKAVLAAFGGVAADGTRFLINPGYDGAYYVSNLALIPGLVFFTIVTETEFNLDLKRLIACLGHKRQPEIEAAKSRILRASAGSLARQSAFQGALAIGLVLAAPLLTQSMGAPASLFAILLAGGFFQLIFLSALNMLFYLELYRDAALSALAFALVNLGLSIAACSSPIGGIAGYPYLAGCIVSAALAVTFAFRGLRRFDRIVFLRASGEEYGR